MRLRTENPQLAAYVTTQGGRLKSVRSAENEEGVTVIFELDIMGLRDNARSLRSDFYRGRVGVSLAEYSHQLGQITERMFMAIHHQEAEGRRGGSRPVAGDEHGAVV